MATNPPNRNPDKTARLVAVIMAAAKFTVSVINLVLVFLIQRFPCACFEWSFQTTQKALPGPRHLLGIVKLFRTNTECQCHQ